MVMRARHKSVVLLHVHVRDVQNHSYQRDTIIAKDDEHE